MAILAGIDEAGYGPILGPLVVSAAAFKLPDSMLGKDLWSVLKKSIGQTKKHLAGRLLISDSKKAFNRKTGTGHLERTIFACLKCLGSHPAALTELLQLLCPQCTNRLQAYPWYQNNDELQRHCDKKDIRIAFEVFAEDMTRNNIKLLSIQSHCLDVAHYNHLIDNVKNKATVLFSTTSALVKSIWDNSRDDNIQIIIDRQGGRTHYRKVLQKMFPNLNLAIIKESENSSSYQLNNPNRKMRLHFTTKADQKYLPVSLASMVSKYVRELLIEKINRYFLNRQPELRPTAGYWKDGLRFIEDLKTHTPLIEYESSQLIRCR